MPTREHAASPPDELTTGRKRGASLRRGLLMWLLIPLLALVPLAAALMYTLTVRPALDALDRDLSGTAQALSNLLVVEGDAVSLPLSEQTERALRTDPYDAVYFVVIDPLGRVVRGDAPLAPLGQPIAAGPWQFSDAVLAGIPIRVVSHSVACGPGLCMVRVAESVGKRDAAQRQVWWGAGITMSLLAMALAALGWIGISRGLRPIDRLSTDIERRSLENLQPINTSDVPREAAPMVDALNRLLDRVRVASLAQQAFMADAAHQLRTPLTALQTETELALLEPHPPEFNATLQRIHLGATRAARLAGQLLTQARTDYAAHNTDTEPVDLKQIASDAAQDWVAASLHHGIDLGFELQPAWVSGHAFMLRELLANLLHNALTYAGNGARVTVRTLARDGHSVLEVEDTGAGIAPEDRERVLERFQRGAGATGNGSGLGLAIVRDIARMHQADLALLAGTHGAGLLVRITFPVTLAT